MEINLLKCLTSLFVEWETELRIACVISEIVFPSNSQALSSPALPPSLSSFITPLFHQNTSPHHGAQMEGGLQVGTLNRCPLQKVMVWDNYPFTSTCLLKMGDSAVVTFQYETVVIRIWISFHSHSGSHPDNTCLTKSTRWNWPVSSISRAICATQPWITAMGGKPIVTPVRMRGA